MPYNRTLSPQHSAHPLIYHRSAPMRSMFKRRPTVITCKVLRRSDRLRIFSAFVCCVVLVSVIMTTIAILYPGSTSAQQALAAVNGIVTDPSGAAVDGAEITLIAVKTRVVRTTVSNGSGAYAFVSVLPGSYSLKVAKEGFHSVFQ